MIHNDMQWHVVVSMVCSGMKCYEKRYISI
jgi:hypothetical protein